MFRWPDIIAGLFPRMRQRRVEDECHNDSDRAVQLQHALQTLCRLPNTEDIQPVASEQVDKVSVTLHTLYSTTQEELHPWASRPRTYIILHNLDCPQLMNEFIREGKTDIWLPYDEETLPKYIQPENIRKMFLKTQRYVLTGAKDLEDMSTDVLSKVLPHINLERSGDQHFKRINTLGTGSYG